MTQSPSPEIKSLRQKLEENPDSLVFGPLADALRKEGFLDEALDVCRKGLERHGHYTMARVVLGRVYQDQGKPTEASAEFKKVLDADPENLQALTHLGELYLGQKRYSEAIEEFQKVLALNPDDDSTQVSLKKAIELAAQEQSKPGSAAAQAGSSPDGGKGAPQEKPAPAKDSAATLTIAELYLKQGHFDKAIEVYQELLAEDPQNLLLRQKLSAAVDQQQKHQSSSGGVASKIKKDEFTRPPDPMGDSLLEESRGVKAPPPKTRKEGRDESKFTNEDILQVMLRGGKDDVMVEEKTAKPAPTPKPAEAPPTKAPEPPAKTEPVSKPAVPPPAPPAPAARTPEPTPAVAQAAEKSAPSPAEVDGLKGILAELAGVEGIQGSFLVREDGTLVVALGKTGQDTAGLSQIASMIFKSTRQAASRSVQGQLHQVHVTAESGQILLVGIAKGILVVLADDKIKIGLLRLALDSSVKKIEKVFQA